MSPYGSEPPHGVVPDYLLLKLASRCNINCTYCYWFRDKSVYARPPLLTDEAEQALLRRLREHVEAFNLKKFSILFHGGEPLLLGKVRTVRLLSDLRELEHDTGIELVLNITSNGVLLDDEWADILCAAEVGVTLSIDGSESVHDLNRIDFRGRGTHDKVLAGLDAMRRRGGDPGVLAVCNPAGDPAQVLRYFVEELKVGVDILVPDATHDDTPASIAAFYCGLFDAWYDTYSDQGVSVRFLSSIVKGLLGLPTGSESIGFGPITTMTVLTDGRLEALDILRTSRRAITQNDLNIIDQPLMSINSDPLWQEIRHASVHLAPACEDCVYKFACGGGHIASRWSNARRYDNPSVYCEDFKVILGHVWQRISPDLRVVVGDDTRIPLLAVSP